MTRCIVFLFLLVLLSCRSKRSSDVVVTEALPSESIIFLDSIQAAKAINLNDAEGFFDKLSVVDMSIQLKRTDPPTSRKQLLLDYRHLLRTEVMTFSEKEKETIRQTAQLAYNEIVKLNPQLWPKKIQYIKTRTNHYGPDVYYTRRNSIVVPANVFDENRTPEQLKFVMLHEIFHLLSRNRPSFRDETFKLIDFSRINCDINIPSILAQRLLTNPDAVTMDYAITLDGPDGKKSVLPMIISTKPSYTPSVPSLFSYLKFDLYELDPSSCTLLCDSKGLPTLGPEYQQDYFNHIKDNTQYIIHPEEIMADNFAILLTANDLKTYSQDGQKLLEKLKTSLKNVKN